MDEHFLELHAGKERNVLIQYHDEEIHLQMSMDKEKYTRPL